MLYPQFDNVKRYGKCLFNIIRLNESLNGTFQSKIEINNS